MSAGPTLFHNFKNFGLCILTAFAANTVCAQSADTLRAGDRKFAVITLDKKPDDKNLTGMRYSGERWNHKASVAIINLGRREIFFDTGEQRDDFLKDTNFVKNILPTITPDAMEAKIELMPAWQYWGRKPQLVVRVLRDEAGSYDVAPFNNKAIYFGPSGKPIFESPALKK